MGAESKKKEKAPWAFVHLHLFSPPSFPHRFVQKELRGPFYTYTSHLHLFYSLLLKMKCTLMR